MLTSRLQEIKNKIEAKSTYLRTDKEKELLDELVALDKIIIQESLSHQFSESVSKSVRVTSGPGGGCPCCGGKG